MKILKIPQKRKKSGFTIIEILVTVSIITVLLGLSYAGFVSFNKRQKLVNTGNNIKNLLRDIQSRNFNGEVDCDICACQNLDSPIYDGYYVDFSSMMFYGKCGSNTFYETEITLPSDISIISSTVDPIHFIPYPPSIDKEVSLCLFYTGESNSYFEIKMDPSGNISDSKGLMIVCPS